jgi:hypothetical protein
VLLRYSDKEPSVKKELWVPDGSETTKQEITIYFQRESEGGCDWPVPRDEAYTDAIVGFALTSRYRPAILDKGHEHGRPEPFEFNPQDILDILEQVIKNGKTAMRIHSGRNTDMELNEHANPHLYDAREQQERIAFLERPLGFNAGRKRPLMLGDALTDGSDDDGVDFVSAALDEIFAKIKVAEAITLADPSFVLADMIEDYMGR